MMNAVKSLLEDYNISIPNKFWRRVRQITKGGPITQDEIPNISQLKRILENGGIKDKALFLFLSTSGARIGEVLKIEEDDLRLENEPPMCKIREEVAEKGRQPPLVRLVIRIPPVEH